MAKKSKPIQNDIPTVRIAQPSGRPFQVRYYCPAEKREIRVSVGSRELAEAEDLKATIEAKLRLGIAVQSKAAIRGPDMDWESFRELYRTLHLNALRDKSVQNAESRLDIAAKIVKPKTLADLAETTTLQILQAKLLAGDHSRDDRPRSPHTVRGYMKAVVAALNWAYLQDWLTSPPKLPRFKASKRKMMKGRPITEDEFTKMLDVTPSVVGEAAAASWQFVLRGLWESALRLEELMNVSWNKPGTIRPAWPQGKSPLLEIPAAMQKNDTDEEIPLLPGFEKLLLEVPEPQRTGWVFNPVSLQTKFGKKVRFDRPDSEWVGKVIARIGHKAEVVVEPGNEATSRKPKYASAHDLRRSCGDRLRNAGVPPLIICRILRHSSWETTRRHYAPGDIQADAKTIASILSATNIKTPET